MLWERLREIRMKPRRLKLHPLRCRIKVWTRETSLATENKRRNNKQRVAEDHGVDGCYRHRHGHAVRTFPKAICTVYDICELSDSAFKKFYIHTVINKRMICLPRDVSRTPKFAARKLQKWSRESTCRSQSYQQLACRHPTIGWHRWMVLTVHVPINEGTMASHETAITPHHSQSISLQWLVEQNDIFLSTSGRAVENIRISTWSFGIVKCENRNKQYEISV